MPPWAVGHSCFTFCCTTSHAAKWVPLVSQCSSSPSRTTSQHEVLGSSGPCISCSSMCIHCSSSSSYLNNLHTCAASRRALSIFTFSAVRKIHPTVPATVHAALSCKWELMACDTFSMLSDEPSTASQSSPGPTPRGPELPAPTGYVVATGFLHSLEPQAPLSVVYPADYASCLATHTVC